MPQEGRRSQGRWGLQLVGEARLVGPEELVRLERKEAALLAYLALEGPTPREQLAELLWPGAEEKGRVNMRQLLRRLRVSAGDVELVEGRETLVLPDTLPVDVLALRQQAGAGQSTQVTELEGALLGAFGYEELPDFHDWLMRAREQLAVLRRRAVAAELERLVALGQLSRALALAERQLAQEPTSEETYRQLMRLHYLLGDRTAALGLYARCREMLRRELDAEPMEETVALARDIERGRAGIPSAPPVRSALPATVLRPPVLAGREEAWAQLEAAWAAGQMIFISGEPGMGKSRLVRDFVASKGACQWFGMRPGDAHVPYASTTRSLRSMLAQRPDLAFEPWIRKELTRLLPELGEPGAPPAPMVSEEDRLRFFEALKLTIGRATQGLAAQVYDDMQFADLASTNVGEYVFGNMFPLGMDGMPMVIVSYRSGELPPATLEVFRRMVSAGVGALITLEPLSARAVEEMLVGMGLPGAASLAGQMARYTGGNPLFVTETVKHLLETGGLERGWPDRLPPPGKVAPLIQRRLGRLSRPATQLAQVAALARSDFGLELAAEVLEVHPLDFAAPLAELEAAQIFRGEAFTHDLVFEAVLASISLPVRQLLHRRLAAVLARRSATPASVARHWLEGEEPQQAVPFLLAAAAASEATLRHEEAAALRARAAAICA